MAQMIDLFLQSGLSVIPAIWPDKRPALHSWKQYQDRLPTLAEAQGWAPPLAIIGGKVSGGLVCIDFDNGGSEFAAWTELVTMAGGDLMSRLVVQKTPSGGFHVLYRCIQAHQRNEKLAQLPNDEVLIETRGEGGYFLCAPTQGYEVIHGKFSAIPVLGLEEHQMLIDLSRSLNQKIGVEAKAAASSTATATSKYEITPFDDYDSRNTPLEMLTEIGWTVLFERNGATYLKRPNKAERGISATWNYVPNRFYVFSSSTQFEAERTYKASSIYAILAHNGDFTAAASALLNMGYGKKKPEQAATQQPEAQQPKRLSVKTARDLDGEIDNLHKNGIPKGTPTGIPGLDPYFLICKGHLTIVSGIPTHGKSEVMDAIMVNVAKVSPWKCLIFSPENYPITMHIQKITEKYVGRRFRLFDNADLTKAKAFVNQHFFFIDPSEESITVEDILATAQEAKPDMLLIDPWNELESGRPAGISETDYIGNTLTRIRKFARKYKIAVFIVAHPQKMRRDKDGELSRPNMYDISGSAHWYNKSDNGFLVWRDFKNDYTEIIVEKVKFKYYGSRTNTGDVKLAYENDSGRYVEKSKAKEMWQP